MKNIIKSINSFDLYYEMSDSSYIITKYTDIERDIKIKLLKLSDIKKKLIHLGLNKNGRQCWDRYFKNIKI